MSRIRSRQLESESVPTRALRDKASTSRKIGTHAVRANKEAWPTDGLVSEGQLDGSAVRFVRDQVIEGAGAPLTLTVEATDVEVANDSEALIEFGADPVRQQIQTWDGPSTEITWLLGGSVFAYIDVDRGNYDGAFTVEVLLDGEVTWTVDVPAVTAGGGSADPNVPLDFQLWTDSTGQVWLVEMHTDGTFTTTAITPRTTEDGTFRVTADGRLRILEST